MVIFVLPMFLLDPRLKTAQAIKRFLHLRMACPTAALVEGTHDF